MTSPEGTFSAGRGLVCDTDLDDQNPGSSGPGIPDDEEAKDPGFGAYVGQSIWVRPTDSSIPTFQAGLSDLSIEMIILPREGDPSLAGDFSTIAGLCENEGGNPLVGSIVIGVTNQISKSNLVRFIWQVGGPSRAVDINPFRDRSSWTHLCCNYNRSSDMELFDNGVSVGTSDISTDESENVPSHGIYPMVGSSSNPGASDDITDDITELILPWYSPIAGFAIHSRILTTDEIEANNLALDTGDYPETQVRYNFRTFVDGLGARVDPPGDTDLDHISVSNKWTVPVNPYGAELFSPEGANGTLHIEDLSGKGKHFGLQTLAAYDDTAVANRGKASFTITGRDFRPETN